MKKMNIFITGGTRGIGQGLVNEFLKRGHNVSFTGTTEASINKASISSTGEHLKIVCDVRNYQDILKARDLTIEKFKTIDIWINNAGINQPRLDVSELSETDIKNLIDINVTGMMHGTSIALALMKKQGYGTVYNMEGLGSDNRTYSGTVIYGSSKRLLRYFSRSSDKELKKYPNIFVGTISPGMVLTDFLKGNTGEETMKIINILANEVEEVTLFLVEKMLKGKKHIYWLTTKKIFFKFFISLFKKNKSSK